MKIIIAVFNIITGFVSGLHAMASDDDLTWTPTSVCDVPRSEGGSPTWSPSSICVEPLSVDGTSLGAPFFLPGGATRVSQNTDPQRKLRIDAPWSPSTVDF